MRPGVCAKYASGDWEWYRPCAVQSNVSRSLLPLYYVSFDNSLSPRAPLPHTAIGWSTPLR
jgi:hypothetical protein